MALTFAVQLPLSAANYTTQQPVRRSKLESNFPGRLLKHQLISIGKVRQAGECYSGPTSSSQLSPPASPSQMLNYVKDSRTAYLVDTELPAIKTVAPNKGWTDAMGMQNQRLLTQFRALAVVATDRTEMHTILAEQRDNWNRLFHSTITIASVSASTAAALNGADQALGLSVVAAILGVGVAALMTLINKFQPTQLAEEQRHGARFFKRLTKDIESTLETDPVLRPEASNYWEEKVGTLHALDNAFPLPLTPVVLEKFPKIVSPSILSSPLDKTSKPVKLSSEKTIINGWTRAAETDLEQVARLLDSSDVPSYVTLAKGANQINKSLAITSPLLAMGGAICSMSSAVIPGVHISCVGAALTVGALVIHSMSHALQMGAVYETYRNCAGYYAEIETSIQKALQLPVQEREDGLLFREKVSLLLGRSPATPHVVESDDKTAGTLF